MSRLEAAMSPPTGIALRPERDEPLYRQLFDEIASRIRSGTFPAGYRLPPTRALAGELAAHRNTVVRAYQELEEAGFVRSTVGRGTFVAPRKAALEAAEAPARPPLPWGNLGSRALATESLFRAERMQRGGGPSGAVNLSRLQPSEDLLPHALVRRCLDFALKREGPRALSYAPREGLPRLRERIAEDLRRQGVPAAAGDLLVTTGSQQALDAVARALVNPGDLVLVEASTYAGALNLWQLAGARLAAIPSDEEGPSLPALERYARSGAKAFYLMPNCNNPTGQRVSVERRRALVSWSHESGVPLVEDDYASDLHLEGQAPLPALRSLDGEVLYLGTYSKKLLPALRTGYLLCPAGIRGPLTALKHAMDLGTSAILQYALAEFLERGYLPAHLARVLPEYRRRRDALESALRRHLPASVAWKRPQTGVSLWIPTPDGIGPEALFQECQAQGVLVSPGTLNTLTPGEARGVRLTFCAEPVPRLVEGARRFARALAAAARRDPGRPARAESSRLETV
jgi:GntR family transcriptional regulator/MocR family aminotransferase